MRSIMPFLCSLLVSSCAAESEDGHPGICKLSCDTAKLGSNDPYFEFKSLLPDLQITCQKGLTSAVTLDSTVVQFMAIEKSKVEGLDWEKPVPGLAFEPIITGIISNFKNDVNKDEVLGDVPQRYKGIKTPKTEWCTDSCGVATVEFEPVCLPAGGVNGINVSLHSGPLYSKTPAKVTVETPDNE